MVGHSIGSPPCALIRSDNSDAWALARVTSTRFPNKGCVSNQLSCSRNRTTSPTTTTVGGRISAAFARSTMSRNVPTTVCCLAYVPHRTSATGVSTAFPSSTNLDTIMGKFLTPIKNTRVPSAAAKRGHSNTVSSLFGSSCPVIKATVEARVRCVTGMPAYAGTATAEVTPGTTSKGIRCSTIHSASSPPRPNTNGSPPFNRTTHFPSRTFSSIN